MPCKGVSHPHFCDKVEKYHNDNGGSASSLVGEGKSNVGKCDKSEKVEDPVAKEVGGEHGARHHTGGVAQPRYNLLKIFIDRSKIKIIVYVLPPQFV